MEKLFVKLQKNSHNYRDHKDRSTYISSYDIQRSIKIMSFFIAPFNCQKLVSFENNAGKFHEFFGGLSQHFPLSHSSIWWISDGVENTLKGPLTGMRNDKLFRKSFSIHSSNINIWNGLMNLIFNLFSWKCNQGIRILPMLIALYCDLYIRYLIHFSPSIDPALRFLSIFILRRW